MVTLVFEAAYTSVRDVFTISGLAEFARERGMIKSKTDSWSFFSQDEAQESLRIASKAGRDRGALLLLRVPQISLSECARDVRRFFNLIGPITLRFRGEQVQPDLRHQLGDAIEIDIDVGGVESFANADLLAHTTSLNHYRGTVEQFDWVMSKLKPGARVELDHPYTDEFTRTCLRRPDVEVTWCYRPYPFPHSLAK